MRVLAIGAHPDDIEIFMYGLLSIYKKQGEELFLTVATDGGLGDPQNKINDKNLAKVRLNETKKALSLLGSPRSLKLPDGHLKYSADAFEIIDKHIRSISPDLIITHPPEDYHPDHYALSQFVLDSASFKCPVLFCETLMGINFNPQYYIDISSEYENKINAIMEHKSQNPKKFVEAVKLMNRYRSAQCNFKNTKYAETYRFENKFPFADINGLIPDKLMFSPYYCNNKSSMI